ncbi:unnamed protein product [Clonostachys rosea]|uniref:Uncharacterized protein n=1 Tax=Bionectria ochroleuca TaxID=29856 RepID=A0ABY6TP78_BIOOC|nr:unnamed protein product [Clonostachys rosea]
MKIAPIQNNNIGIILPRGGVTLGDSSAITQSRVELMMSLRRYKDRTTEVEYRAQSLEQEGLKLREQTAKLVNSIREGLHSCMSRADFEAIQDVPPNELCKHFVAMYSNQAASMNKMRDEQARLYHREILLTRELDAYKEQLVALQSAMELERGRFEEEEKGLEYVWSQRMQSLERELTATREERLHEQAESAKIKHYHETEIREQKEAQQLEIRRLKMHHEQERLSKEEEWEARCVELQKKHERDMSTLKHDYESQLRDEKLDSIYD